MSFVLKKAIDEDIDLIVKYENEIFHNFATYDQLKNDIDNPLIDYYLFIGNEIYGYAGLWVDDSKAQIITIAIFPEFRNKGYGYRLLRYLESKFKELGVEEITLEVRPSNAEAIKLYEKCGFKQVAVRKAYYNNGEDALMMYKKIGSG